MSNLFIKKNILFLNAGLGKDPVPVSPDLAKKGPDTNAKSPGGAVDLNCFQI